MITNTSGGFLFMMFQRCTVPVWDKLLILWGMRQWGMGNWAMGYGEWGNGAWGMGQWGMWHWECGQ